MSKFIEIEGRYILKNKIILIDKIYKSEKDDYGFRIDFLDIKSFIVFCETHEQAEAERNRIIEELEKD